MSCKIRLLVWVLEGSSSVFEGYLERNGSFHVHEGSEMIDFGRMFVLMFRRSSK